MIFLCDAMNIMYQIDDIYPILKQNDLNKARLEFIKVVDFFSHHYKTRKNHSFNLFFDGPEDIYSNPSHSSNIFLHYSYDKTIADDKIKDFIKQSKIRENLCVVSSDREVKDYSMRKKCKCWQSQDFINEYEKLKTKNTQMKFTLTMGNVFKGQKETLKETMPLKKSKTISSNIEYEELEVSPKLNSKTEEMTASDYLKEMEKPKDKKYTKKTLPKTKLKSTKNLKQIKEETFIKKKNVEKKPDMTPYDFKEKKDEKYNKKTEPKKKKTFKY